MFLLVPHHSWSLRSGWQTAGSWWGEGLSLDFRNSSLCTNDQSHLELPGLKSTFTYLSQQGGFEKAVVGHKQTKLIR